MSSLYFFATIMSDKGNTLRSLHIDISSLSSSSIEYLFKTLLRYFEYLSYTGRSTLEIPDMGNRSCEFDVTHSFTADSCSCNFNAAAVADLALEADLLELTAVTLPVLSRSEYSFTEKTVTLWLLGSVIYSLRSFNNTVRPASDLFR